MRGWSVKMEEERDTKSFARLGLMAALVGAYIAVGVYFNFVLRSGIIYTHIAYLPIVISGIWWGRRAVVVAVLLSLVTLIFHLSGHSSVSIWDDVARVAFFVVVALCVGMLSEKVHSGKEALELSQEKYRFLVDKSLAGILLYQDEKILFASTRFAGIIGYAPEELAGRSIWDLIHEDDRARVRELVSKRAKSGSEDLRYECRLLVKNGGTVWVDVASSVQHYEGASAVLVNVYDITSRKKAEDRRRELTELTRRQEEQLVHSTRLAELGEMAASIAHELNQPLTGIRNFARNAYYMIEQNAGSMDEVKGNLDLISGQVDRAAKIIGQMRELTRKSERSFDKVSVDRIVEETTEFLMPQFKLSGVEVRLALSGALPEVMGDRTRLEQVFLNLLTNARQAMEDSATRRLSIRTYEDAGSECPVVVEIRDTGKGFEPSETKRIFAPFYSTKGPGKGTGLGLSISLSIIKDHDGSVEAEGVPGKGACFTIRLPVRKREESAEERKTNE
jgi:PAS domain S-box-containing protein